MGKETIKANEGRLYEITLDALMKRLESEDCSAADINAARAFIKDHGIQGGETMRGKERGLGMSLPDFGVVRKGKIIDEDNSEEGTYGESLAERSA